MCLTKDYFGTPGWNRTNNLRIKSSMNPLSIKRLWEPLPLFCHKFPPNALRFEGIGALREFILTLIVWYQLDQRIKSPMDGGGMG